MSNIFRVIDVRQDGTDIGVVIKGAQSPEAATRDVLGLEVVRSGAKRDLVAKVYWQPVGQPLSMVRLYRKVCDRPL